MEIKIGQIWQDWDCRIREDSEPRLLKINSIPNDLIIEVENIKTKRKTIISQDRMKPNSTGYKLVKDVK